MTQPTPFRRLLIAVDVADRYRAALPAAVNELGVAWEELAGAHLQRAGLAVIARNFRTRFGEIDLVCRDGDVLVFVEVRYRARITGYGSGADSITASKRQRLVTAASQYRQAHPALSDLPCRFDVVAITGTEKAPVIDWRQRAFDAA